MKINKQTHTHTLNVIHSISKAHCKGIKAKSTVMDLHIINVFEWLKRNDVDRATNEKIICIKLNFIKQLTESRCKNRAVSGVSNLIIWAEHFYTSDNLCCFLLWKNHTPCNRNKRDTTKFGYENLAMLKVKCKQTRETTWYDYPFMFVFFLLTLF